MEKEVIISFELANALHGFLITKPMNKVENLVLGLRAAKSYTAPAPVEVPKPDTPPSE